MSWNLNLCMQYWDKVLVPFHYFVKPEPQPTLTSTYLRFPFLHLPIDLQLIVFEHCDAPTLFWLMQTCTRTRRSATKLFWENARTDHWYHCADDSLFDHRPRTYTFLQYCPKFAARITNVEIELIRIELYFSEDHRASTATKAKTFWDKLETIFPSVRAVTLTGCTPRQPCPPPPGESDEEYSTIETAVQCAPTHIAIYVAFVPFPGFNCSKPPRNSLWQVPIASKPMWRMLDADWKPTRVLLPDRKWSISPLGDYLTFTRRYHSLSLELRGIEWLMIESYARYAVHGTIHCPHLDCSATYTQRESWQQHLASGHGRFDIIRQSERDHMMELVCYRHTPEFERLSIEARHQRLETQYLEVAKIRRRVGHGWGPPGSEQRRLFEEEFKAQLREESLFAPEEPVPGGRDPTIEAICNLALWFDRTHVYHGCGDSDSGHICYEG
ncbi:hypothetical protein BKA63DRAFT_511644 [Paraphoma chrysanthemicola]|nr:hypothetical protein BKA63DRAFT_511644 [Paraphoma chrysanthemicola]